MGGSRLIPDFDHEDPRMEENVFPEDEYIRQQRQLYPDVKTQEHMISYWKIHSDYLDAIIPNHQLTIQMFHLQIVLKESYDKMKARNAVDRFVPQLVMKSLIIQKDFLDNATRLATIFTRAQLAYINHSLTFGDPNRNVDSVWEYYETMTHSFRRNWEDFSHILTIILLGRSYLRTLLANIKECYESTLHIITSCRDVLAYIDEFVDSHPPLNDPFVYKDLANTTLNLIA